MSKRVILSLVILIGCCVREVKPKSQYVMPMSMGMKMSIPYDIANIFIRPIAGVVGVSISIGLLIILFFGVITSPFGYFFGIPSRKYVLGTATDMEASPRLLSEPQNFLEASNTSEAFFYWMDSEDLKAQCQLLALCHAHSAFQLLPSRILQLYSIFSEYLVELPLTYRRAIVLGLADPAFDLCTPTFSSCPQSGFSLIVKTLLRLLPEKVKNEHFRKRKGAMYMPPQQ